MYLSPTHHLFYLEVLGPCDYLAIPRHLVSESYYVNTQKLIDSVELLYSLTIMSGALLCSSLSVEGVTLKEHP